jgi:3-oxo-4,17-pregnadiene-20-carboxyl-CoA hydratase beta subunit
MSAVTAVGEQLPEVTIEATPTFIVSTALATRDFQDVHHDRDRAVAGGSKDIFLNILTSTGLVQRYVSEWAGPGAVVRGVAIRLGVPCYAYETLVLSGQVASREGAEVTVSVVGRVSTGEHVSGTVTLRLTGEATA